MEKKFKKGDKVKVVKEVGEKVPVFFGKKMNVSYVGKTGTVTGSETAKDGSTHVFVEIDEKDEKAFGYLAKEFKEEELEKV